MGVTLIQQKKKKITQANTVSRVQMKPLLAKNIVLPKKVTQNYIPTWIALEYE